MRWEEKKNNLKNQKILPKSIFAGSEWSLKREGSAMLEEKSAMQIPGIRAAMTEKNFHQSSICFLQLWGGNRDDVIDAPKPQIIVSDWKQIMLCLQWKIRFLFECCWRNKEKFYFESALQNGKRTLGRSNTTMSERFIKIHSMIWPELRLGQVRFWSLMKWMYNK